MKEEQKGKTKIIAFQLHSLVSAILHAFQGRSHLKGQGEKYTWALTLFFGHKGPKMTFEVWTHSISET